ncbi:Dos2-interacting transcription regulator of RNA-Pol-II-domain-containing protein [Linnemannia elongata]|nr:Dos2-interacting transcription regulator of RNA-Pol-II-domain-containing protein [Linnemannia elongata]KAK5823279.1 Dos2-interacting transcription regulator of RNA-Pol-II-domain-containing protein [Linnemannia elongata]
MDRLISTYILAQTDSQEQADAAIQDIVKDVGTNPTKLLMLVQGLGEYLTSDEAFVRSKATALLSTTLATLDQSKVNASAVTVLVEFYCDRLTDQACVPELLKGLLALSKFDKFTSVDCIKSVKAILALVNVQTYQQTARHYVFLFFESVIKRYSQNLKPMSSDFVFGFIQCLDGEKDPRNLMLAFTLIKNIIQEFDIAQHVEDLFEVTFCYFPITFRPPPDDPYGITSEHLKVGLRDCLAATPYFAKFALPLLLEKLSSSSGSAKKDSMETIAACAPVYGSSALTPYAEELWSGLQNEIFHATGDELEQVALNTLQVITTELSMGVSLGGSNDPVEKFLRPIISDCMTQLQKPEMKLAKPSGKILKACAMASDPACTAITLATIPTLLSQYSSSDQSTRKKALLDVLLDFLEASRVLYGSAGKPTEHDTDFVTPLLTFKDRFFELFTNALLSSNEYNALRLAGVKGLHGMILLREFLSETEISYAIQYFVRIVLEDPDVELQETALNSLSSLALIMPGVVRSMALPSFFEMLPTSQNDMEVDTVVQKKSPEYILNAVTKIGAEPTLFADVVPQILEKLDLVANDFSSTHATYPIALLTTLLVLLRSKATQGHSDLPQYLDNLVPRLIGLCIYPTVSLDDGDSVMKNSEILEVVAGITRVVMIHVDTKAQQEFVKAIFRFFVSEDLSTLAMIKDKTHHVPFTPLRHDSRVSQQNTCVLFSTVIDGCRQQTILPVDNLQLFTGSLVDVAIKSTNAIQRTALSKAVATILNKYNKGGVMESFISQTLIPELHNIMRQEQTAFETREAALIMYTWITKAMVLSTSAIGYDMTGELMSIFSVPRLGKLAADGFNLVIGEQRDVLTKESFAVLRLLYKQRFFNHCVPVLVKGFESSANEVRHNFLIALSHVLRNIPKQVLLTELPPLLPMLVHSLSFPDPELKASTIETFQIITKDAPGLMAEHLSTLTPLLVSLTSAKDPANTMKVRSAALKCLGAQPKSLPFTALRPYKTQVLKELEKCLDDRKRVVRREAVECRSQWFTLNGSIASA